MQTENTTKAGDSTQHRFDIAFELNVANEKLSEITQIDDCLFWRINSTEYSCRLSKVGKIKRGSVRLG